MYLMTNGFMDGIIMINDSNDNSNSDFTFCIIYSRACQNFIKHGTHKVHYMMNSNAADEGIV